MIIIFLTLGLVLVSFGVGIKHYLYQEISDTFQRYAESVPSVWTRQSDASHLNLTTFSDTILSHYKFQGAELYLLNRKGQLIQSSLGYYQEENYAIPTAVLQYKTMYQVEKNEWNQERIMAVYTPLMNEGHVVGILRYVTSLEQVDQTILHLLFYAVLISILIAILVFLVSFQLGNSIVKPLKDIILLTKKMAEGNYQEKIEKTYPHEAGELVSMLNHMGEEIKKTDRLKNEFISSISHELRTPLTGIKGWLETMTEDEELSKEEMEFGFRVMNQETTRLIHLVEGLLDFSRYQTDRIILSIQRIKIEEVIKEAIFQLQKKAEDKDILLHSKTSTLEIFADRDRVKQVLLNVIDNAIKFSNEHGEIQINQMNTKEEVTITVKDYGIGMKQKDLSYVTKSFYKIDEKAAGEGLGLSISQKIIALHKGELSISSEYGKGTTVSITLPMNVAYEELEEDM